MPTAVAPDQSPLGIRDTWNSNIDEEFKRIRDVVKEYNYIAMVSFMLLIT